MSNGRVVLLAFVFSGVGAFVGASLVGLVSAPTATEELGQRLAVTKGFVDVQRRLDRLEERLAAVIERSVGRLGAGDAGDVADGSGEPVALDVPAPSPVSALSDDDVARLAAAVEQAVVRAQSGVVESRPLDVDAVEELWARLEAKRAGLEEGRTPVVSDMFGMTPAQVVARLGRPTFSQELPPPQPYTLQWTYQLDHDRRILVMFAGGLVTVVHPPL